jgi:hypothetical protein
MPIVSQGNLLPIKVVRYSRCHIQPLICRLRMEYRLVELASHQDALISALETGGVATLNHRLMADKPPAYDWFAL